jgi:cob(I)alamin adenosyltransferase
MVNLTRIYTKTGDDGTTSLGDMSRTSKNDPRLEAYATVDEAIQRSVLCFQQMD